MPDILRKTSRTLHLHDTKVLSSISTSPRTEGIFAIASQLFSLSFEKMNEPTWHEDVQAFSVQRNGKEIARIFLDLFPRPNKYQHAAVFGIRESCKDSQGERTIPQAALVCNFPKPGTSPALMMHESVTIFHEFGHILHHILSTASREAKRNHVARDFVETPSQLFEAGRESITDLFARHYTNEPLPKISLNATCEHLETQSRPSGNFATFDQRCHGENVPEHKKDSRELYPQFSSFTRGEIYAFLQHSVTLATMPHITDTNGHLLTFDAQTRHKRWYAQHKNRTRSETYISQKETKI
jgi:thimet oligopeptidase